MPINYSKWDALELSDDSDIEVHPNVDKRSFIRAKQNQIHQQRFDRKHRITTLQYERVVNDGLLARIDALLKALDGHKAEIEGKTDAADIDEVVFDCLADVVGDGSLGPDQPPGGAPGVHAKEQQPSYSKMMGALADQVKTEIDRSQAVGAARYTAFQKGVGSHHTKVQTLQKDLHTELAKLEKEEGSKITSDSIHTGFNLSHVSKAAPEPPAPQAAAAKTSNKKKTSTPELLNNPVASQSPGSEADIEDGSLHPISDSDSSEEADFHASPTAKLFAAVPYGDYRASLQFISSHPSILAESETDGLLAEAFTSQSRASSPKEEDYARQCVHQALLLQYCRQLGKDGVGLFFQRVQTPGHQARKLFLDDVNSTYARIWSRTAELAKEREAEGTDGEKELIQLHAVDPNTKINIITPPPLTECTSDEERAARQIFETFPPGLRRALGSGSLERVNEVLAKMSVDEAEGVVEMLGQGGMLSLEEGVIDGTTEEGKKTIEEIERTGRMPGAEEGEEGGVVGEVVGEVEEMD